MPLGSISSSFGSKFRLVFGEVSMMLYVILQHRIRIFIMTYCCGVVAEFLCDCCDAALGCQFDFSGIAVVLLWDFYRIAMRLLS